MSAKNITQYHPTTIATTSVVDLQVDLKRNLDAIAKTLLDVQTQVGLLQQKLGQ